MFKKYQNKIEHSLEKSAEILSGKEGFTDMEGKSLTKQTDNVISNNNYLNQQQIIDNLRKEYQNTTKQYEDLVNKISGNLTSYVDRVNPKNQYLNKVVQFTTGDICYVTSQGIVKYIPSSDIWKSTNISQSIQAKLNIPYLKAYSTPGTQIPTNPPLISGTELQTGQSVGNEGSNVFVNKFLPSDITPKYMGCYAANSSNDNMTFSYIDYRQSVQSLTRNDTIDQPRNNVRNIGGQGRLINKVFFAYEDPNRRTTITDTLTGRYTAVGSSASGTSVKPMVSNLFVNSEFLYPQSINNCARQFHNLQEVGGMVPFVSRECYSGEGSGGLAPTGKDADVEGYVQDTLAGQFFWQGFKTSGLASRVDSRGIDLHTDIQLDDLNGKTKTAYVQRCWLEVVRYLTIVDGHLEVFYA